MVAATREDCQRVAELHKNILTEEYLPTDFEDADCPTTSSHRDDKEGRITAPDRRRAKKSVEVQLDFAQHNRRRDLGGAEWDALRAQVLNPNLDSYKLILAKKKRASTPDGRCEKALSRWLKHRGTWAGSTSYGSKTNYSWLWYVQHLLPHYFQRTEAWRTSKDSYFKHRAFLWSSRGTKLLKGKVSQQRSVYSLPAYCIGAAKTISIVFNKLLSFFNPEDGEDCKPTVPLTANIVLGAVQRDSIIGYLLQTIRDSAAPAAKPDVFSDALELFGSSGPITSHPFTHKYDIVQAMHVRRRVPSPDS